MTLSLSLSLSLALSLSPWEGLVIEDRHLLHCEVYQKGKQAEGARGRGRSIVQSVSLSSWAAAVG